MSLTTNRTSSSRLMPRASERAMGHLVVAFRGHGLWHGLVMLGNAPVTAVSGAPVAARMRMRPVNFSPGPSIVAPEVLEAAAKALIGVPEVQGLSIVEISHRLPWFEKIVAETRDAIRRLMGVPAGYEILFL